MGVIESVKQIGVSIKPAGNNRSRSLQSRLPKSNLLAGLGETEVYPSLRTKIHPPRPDGVSIRRERLEQLYSEILERRLTILIAPPGCGKSTLASQWARRLMENSVPVAWYSIGQTDGSPKRFFKNLAFALSVVGSKKTGNYCPTAWPRGTASPEDAALAIIEWLVANENELVLFLDDYYRVRHAEIDHLVAALLQNGPDSLHIVIVSTQLPSLPVGSMRARNQLLEVGSQALGFTESETLALLKEYGATPRDAGDIEEVLRITHGWAAAIRITALAVRSAEFSLLEGGCLPRKQISEVLEDYLSDLLLFFPSDLVEFMADLSVVNPVSESLCATLVPSDKAVGYFRHLRRQQLLVLRSSDEQLYSYPRVLRHFLHRKLQEKGGKHVATLHRRASDWYSMTRMWEKAAFHAFAAQEFQRVLEIVELYGKYILKEGTVKPLLKWHQQIRGGHEINAKAKLLFAWAYAISLLPVSANELLESVESSLSDDDTDGTMSLECCGIRAVSFALADNIERAQRLSQRCLDSQVIDPWVASIATSVSLYCAAISGLWEVLPSEVGYPFDQVEGNSLLHLVRLGIQGLASLNRGELGLAEKYSLESARLVRRDRFNDAIALFPVGLLAYIYYEQGRFEDLREILDGKLVCIENEGYLESVLRGGLAAAKSAVWRGDFSEAHSILERLEQVAISRGWIRLHAWVLLERLWLYLHENCLFDAERCGQRLGGLINVAQTYSPPTVSLVRDIIKLADCYLAIHIGRFEEAIPALNGLLENRIGLGSLLTELRLMGLLIVAYSRSGRTGEAADTMHKVLLKASRSGLISSIVEQGPEICMLAVDVHRSILRSPGQATVFPYIDKFVAQSECFYGRVLPCCVQSSSSIETTLALLTPRELDVLQVMAEGQSNKEIARTLGVTPETVKTHMKSIFAKLSVDRRIQAISRARDLGLLIPANSPLHHRR